MQSKFISLSILLLGLLFSSQLLAADTCEMPPGIDEDLWYTIKFEGAEERRFIIVDIDDCWVRLHKKKGIDDLWIPIDGIQYIQAEGDKPTS